MSERLVPHLSDKNLEDYQRRTMSPAELIAADDHLAICDDCSHRVRHSDDPENMYVNVPADVPTANTGESDHLSYDQLASYVDRQQDEVEREICDVHLQICKQCSDDLRDLSVFQSSMAESSFKDSRSVSERLSFWGLITHWSSLQFAVVGSLAVLFVAVVAWSLLMMSRTRRTEIGNIVPLPAPSVSPASAVSGPAKSPSLAASPELAITLNDGDGQVTLDKEGNLQGLHDPSHEQLIRTVLITGNLNLPSELKELSRAAGVLMGGNSAGVSFALLSPVGTVVRTAHPTFYWHALSGASSYIVNIYDTSFNKVASSLNIPANHWTSTISLQHGAVYLWQVTAIKDGVEIKSPVQPAPEARFKILDQIKTAELERVKRAHPNSHLLLGTLYAQAGLLDDAEREFRALVAANPKSPVAQKLLRDVRR